MRKRLWRVLILMFILSVTGSSAGSSPVPAAPAESALFGVDFPGSAGVTFTMRFRFLNPLPIYPATYIWRAYPRQQPSYFTTFFWGNDDGHNDISTFAWDNGVPGTFYGAHPYPIDGTHKWEIATDEGMDFLSVENVQWNRWYTQTLVAWADSRGFKHTLFYWDLPDTSKVLDYSTEFTSGATYGNKNPPVPALTFGDAPWNPGNEVYNGILRGIQVYSTNLSLSDIQSEATTPLSTAAGTANIWYLNMNPTPTDISDKSGAGHNPSWVGTERPSLYTETTNTPPLTLSPATLVAGTVGVSYSQTIAASGGTAPYSLNIVSGSLTAGLVWNRTTGTIAGVPTALGTATFTVLATDSGGNTASQVYSITTSNLISDRILLSLNGLPGYNSMPFPGFVGRLTINLTMTNPGTPITGPMFFRVTALQKVLPDQDPAHPNLLLSADNGHGTVGDVQSFAIPALGTGQSTPVSFLVGIGSRQTFSFFVDLFTVPGSEQTLLDAEPFKAGLLTDSRDTGMLGRVRFEISETNVGGTAHGGPQSRPAVAVDPVVPERMAVAFNDYGSRTVKVSTTDDGGTTWYETALSRSVGDRDFYNAQDPNLAFDSRGRLSVVYTVSNVNDSSNAVVISESPDGMNFAPPAAIHFNLASDGLIDSRPVIAVNRRTGRYVAWQTLSTRTSRYSINVARSEEGGVFEPVTTVVTDGLIGSPALALGKNRVYLGWNEWGHNSVPPYETGGRLMIASAPGGGPLRFGKEQEIARTGIGFAGRIPAMPEQGVAPNLYLAVDPDKDAVLFATFVDRGRGTDIRLTRSDDSGRTWQAFTVNDDGTSADQFSPALTVDSENAANIVFYDTRLSSTFEAADIFLATFSHGISLGNRRITSVSSDDSRRNSRRDLTANLGDRTAIAVTRDKVVIAWTDTRLGTERIFLSIIRL